MAVQTILGRVRKEKDVFEHERITIVPGYTFSQRETLNQIELYHNSRFMTGDLDDDGWKKPFFNIVRKPCMVASKEIDLDTKDILIRAENGDYVTAELMAGELKQWLKDQNFGKDLNEYADNAPKYGSVVVKKVKNRLYCVDVKKLVLSNQSADSLDQTDIIEPHLYTINELKLAATENGWDAEKVKTFIAYLESKGKFLAGIDERYGYLPESDVIQGGSADKLVYAVAIVAGADELEKSADGKTETEMGQVLHVAAIDTHPYREWHFMKVPGRWLGLGFVELLFDAQIRANEVAYYKAKGLIYTSLHLFQTDDDTITKNMLNDVKNGDVIRTQQGRSITPVIVDERNLAHYGSEEQRWDSNVADLTFTPEIITGEGLPSGTPARSAIITDQNVKKFFDRKREDFGIWVRELIRKDILPLFKQEKNQKHVFSFTGVGPERDRLEELVVNTRLVAAFEDFLKRTGRVPALAEWQRFEGTERQRIARSRSLDIKMAEGLYEHLDERLDVVITKENEDTDAKIAGRQLVLQALAANPDIAVNPITRPIFMELANLLGVKNMAIPPLSAAMSAPTPDAAAGAEPLQPGPTIAKAPQTDMAMA